MRINKMMFLKPYNKEVGWENTNLTSGGSYKITARFLNNKYIAGYFNSNSSNGTGISVSDDGLTWIDTDLSYSDPVLGNITPIIADISYGDSKYVAVSGFVFNDQFNQGGGGNTYNEARIRTSGDGLIWNTVGIDYFADGLLFTALTFGNSKFIATLSNSEIQNNYGSYYPTNGSKVITSTDGVTWTEISNANLPVVGVTSVTDPDTGITDITSSMITDIKFFNNKFIIIGTEYLNAGISRYFSYTSTDGVTWVNNTDLNIPIGNKLVIGNGLIVCISTAGGNSIVYSSSDGLTWTSSTINNLFINSNNMAYGAGRYVLSMDYSIFTSTDLLNWTVATTLNWSNSFLYANSKFFCYAGLRVDYVTDYTSLDGLSWKYENVPWAVTAGGNETREGVVTNYARYSLRGYNDAFTTDNGKTWFSTQKFARNNKIIKSGNFFYCLLVDLVTQKTGLYKEVGLNNWVLVATMPAAFDGGGYVYDFSYNGTTIIVKAYDNTFYYTNDNTTWTQKTFSGVSNSSSVFGLSWLNPKFVVFIDGHCHSTVDGTTWVDEGSSEYAINSYSQIPTIDNSKLLYLKYNSSNSSHELRGSTDGTTFNLIHEFNDSSSGYNIVAVIFSQGKYIVYLGDEYSSYNPSRLFISTDASNWTDISSKLVQNNQEYKLTSISSNLLTSGDYSHLYIRKI